MSGTSIVVDIVVAVLLVVTIGFVWRLERRIAMLKREEARFAELLGEFGAAAMRAEQGVKALRAAAEGAGRDLEAVIARAQGLRDDVQYLLDRAGPVTDRLSDSVMRSRIRPSQTSSPSPSPDAAPRPARDEARQATPPRAAAIPGGVPAGADPSSLASLLQTLR
jgi:hypothetical protein